MRRGATAALSVRCMHSTSNIAGVRALSGEGGLLPKVHAASRTASAQALLAYQGWHLETETGNSSSEHALCFQIMVYVV